MASSLNAKVSQMSYPELVQRQAEVKRRLGEVALPKAPPKKRKSASLAVPIREKTDTHYDFLLKEMQWLAADFQAERKRHTSGRKKISNAVKQFHKSKETRMVRELADAEVKRRRLAARIGREVKGWWTKIERVISYKQKLSADEERRKAMNKQLVALVKQTEKYSDSLARQQMMEDEEEESEEGGGHRRMTIEEALAAGLQARRSKTRITDYTRVQLKDDKNSFYGESTASDSGSDTSYTPENDWDDETTMLEAEQAERLERRRMLGIAGDSDVDEEAFEPDPVELRKLQEESSMDIEQVIKRLQNEASEEQSMDMDTEQPRRRTKRVKFAGTVQVSETPKRRRIQASPKPDPGEDADDDADASDVENFMEEELELSDDGSEDFVADQDEIDDETTIAHEENLPQEMSAQDEIKMLQDESELPIEELRKRYAAALGQGESTSDSRISAPQEQGSFYDMLEANDAAAEDEFQPDLGADVDDETTIEAEEKLGRDMSYDEELELLQQENEIPIEELRRRYASMDGHSPEGEDEEMESMAERQSLASQLLSRGDNDDADADEFKPDSQEAIDDETTIEAEERLGRDMSYEDEIALLKREGEMSVEELRALYSGMEEVGETDAAANTLSYLEGAVGDEENDDEFRPVGEEKDDESTIAAEERLGREMSPEDEIAMLKEESEIPVESLRAMYQQKDTDETSPSRSQSKRKRETDDESSPDKEEDVSDEGRAALDALEASAERARRTTATRPYILSPWVKLREYQQIGLNWLVSLQSRRLNGILADEMGLGKTLQTIALIAYLAAYKGIWGPHLIVVPTSVILNWETELKRFCPALKVLCYYGSAKRRKELRTGWTKTNWYHVVITSYQLAVQDAFAFKRKRWYYLVLDEAQNIKNFQSQRWQTLINFNSQRRLLLTGTPLQNNLMELWSLLHFLMPYIFRSRKEFSYWFASPMNSMIEGTTSQNDEVIARLHGIIRPFVLRRLKKDVETQMPGKYEHIIKCQLSRRQMFIYEEFMARSSTRQALKKGGNFMGMMNVLMQLRKVCNHPDLFEPRSIVTPFVVDPVSIPMAACVVGLRYASPVLTEVSQQLLLPLWCGSTGEPSVDAALKHDTIEADELVALKSSSVSERSTSIFPPEDRKEYPPALNKLLSSLYNRECSELEDRRKFLSSLNNWRCKSHPFAYPRRLFDAISVGGSQECCTENDILSSPTKLLEACRNQQQRADDVDSLVKKFIFCVPKADARCPSLETSLASTGYIPTSTLDEMLLEPLEDSLRPFRQARARLSSFFPDKKLIQFDAGKLQTLAELLRELKRGGHRALIFTQMSKMLDILETFLNLNGHTYLRLDGSTGVERRQRLMDRFNSDPKIFCFILSTRSGGLGINLTGADTVIFYDSDWNPAMDAQAQDRAHRIGQTREVHIFRLVTEHTIEENILIKARQKRTLDILVMDRGKFDASQLFGHGRNAKASSDPDESKEMYTKGSLRAILGVETESSKEDSSEMEGEESGMSNDLMEKTMTSLEDADDVQALRGAQKEVADELREFDESVEIKKASGSDDEDEVDKKSGREDKKAESDAEDSKKKEEELEKEFAALQDKVGMDAVAIEASLSPTERYGLRFREGIDPYYSIFAVMEYRRKLEAEAEVEDEFDIDEIERAKAREEKLAMDEGDLLATRPSPEELIRQRNLYQREKARLRANKKRRKLTGENWETRTDGLTKLPFWYNIDTGEAMWEKPNVLLELESYKLAHEKRYAALPIKPLVHTMSFLAPLPDRMNCAVVCKQWRKAATDHSFIRHVYPVEMGAYTRDEGKMEPNHYRTVSEAVSTALPGDTIEMSDGHYWINEDLVIDTPLRLVGDENNPTNVIIEMGGTLHWRAAGGWCEGVTFRRPKISSAGQRYYDLLRLENQGRIDVVESVFDNEGNPGTAVKASGNGKKGVLEGVLVKGGGIALDDGAEMELKECSIKKCEEFGVSCRRKSSVSMTNCKIEQIKGTAVTARDDSQVKMLRCHVTNAAGGILEKETGSTATCSSNTATKSASTALIPGFRFVDIE